MALDFLTAFYIVFAVLGTIFVFVLMGLAAFLYRREWLRVNNIDFLIYDMNKDKNMSARIARGRKIIIPAKSGTKGGETFVIAGRTIRSTREILGDKIGDNNLIHSSYGPRRKICILAHKDGVYTPMDITENPDSLSLTPIRSEALSTVLMAKEFAAEQYKESKNRFLELLASGAMIALIILIIGMIIIFIIALTQGPDFVNSIRVDAAPVPPPQ